MWLGPWPRRRTAVFPGHCSVRNLCRLARDLFLDVMQRLAYLDNLKVLLVVGVIAVHARSPTASTARGTWSPTTRWRAVLVDALSVVIVIGWLFGLGLFFLIAGRLSSPSLDRKGPGEVRARASGSARDSGARLYAAGQPSARVLRLPRERGTARAASGRSSAIRSGISAPARPGSSRRCWRSHSATRCCAAGDRRRARPHRRRCGGATWRASWSRSPSARLPPTSRGRSAASSSTCSSGCSRST